MCCPAPLPSRVAPSLRAIIDRCLEKDANRRYQRAGEVHAALETLHAGEAFRQVAVRSRMTPSRWASAVLALSLAAGYVGWRILRPARTDGPTSSQRAHDISRPGALSVPFSRRQLRGIHVDGAEADNTDIYVQQIGAGAPLRLTDSPRNDYNPVWSPDGRWIAFLRGDPATLLGRSRRELRLIAPLGGPERSLGDVSVRKSPTAPSI